MTSENKYQEALTELNADTPTGRVTRKMFTTEYVEIMDSALKIAAIVDTPEFAALVEAGEKETDGKTYQQWKDNIVFQNCTNRPLLKQIKDIIDGTI